MTQKITRRQALGTAGAAFLAAGGVGSLEPFVAAVPAAAATEKKAGSVAVTPNMTEGPYWVDEMLRRFDVRANTARRVQRRRPTQAGVPLTSGSTSSTPRTAARSTGRMSTSGTQTPTASTPTSPASRQEAARQRQHERPELPARLPDHRRRRGRRRKPGQRPGQLQDDLARLVLGPRNPHPRARRTYAARARSRTTRPRSSSRTPTTRMSSRVPRRTTHARRSPTRRRTRPTASSTASADATNIVPVTGEHRRRLRRDVHDRAQRRRLEAAAATADASVSASLRSRGRRDAPNGNRTVVVNIHAGETLTAHAPSLTRHGHLLAKATGHLSPGWHPCGRRPVGCRGRRSDREVVLGRRRRQHANADAVGATPGSTQAPRRTRGQG